MSEPNWENWKKLRDHIALQPEEQVRMDKLLWINRDSETAAEARRPECGTVACIAGHAACLFVDDATPLQRDASLHGTSNLKTTTLLFVAPWSVAARALGISQATADEYDEPDADYVFYGLWHPEKEWQDKTDDYRITKAEVLGYLDKAIAEKNVRVSL